MKRHSQKTSSIVSRSISGADLIDMWMSLIVSGRPMWRTRRTYKKVWKMLSKECFLRMTEMSPISVPFWLSKVNPLMEESSFGHPKVVDWSRMYLDFLNLFEPPHSLAPLRNDLLQRMGGGMEQNSSEPTHRIVFRVHGGRLRISCYCRANPLKHSRQKGGGDYYEPFEVGAYESVYDAYNEPRNHFAPFTDGDKINVRSH